jgi:hypothetical protein
MDPKTLRERLAKLHADLASVHRENPATRESLGEVLPDVERMVDQPPGAADSAAGTLRDRLERIAVQFEAVHPRLAASARQLIDLLGEAGI